MPYKDPLAAKANRAKRNERIKEGKRKHYALNRERILEQQKQRRKINPLVSKKQMFSMYRRKGIKNLPSDWTDVCECCSVAFTKTLRRCMDHDHTTMNFRGWICTNCNIIEGHLRSLEHLKALRTYFIEKVLCDTAAL